jgi:hypothetical protein
MSDVVPRLDLGFDIDDILRMQEFFMSDIIGPVVLGDDTRQYPLAIAHVLDDLRNPFVDQSKTCSYFEL